MTISTTAPRAIFNCDGISKVFPVPIQAYQPTDFLVIHTTAAGVQSVMVLNSDYSLATSGSLQPTAWSLTTLPAAAYPAGDTVQAILNPVQQQQTQYVQGQAFPSLAIQTNVDRLTQMVQRLQDEVSRSIRAQDGDISPAMQMPTSQARALTYAAFDVNGNLLCTPALPGTANTPASLGPILYPRSPAEIAAGVTPLPANQIYFYGDLRRYGGVGGAWGALPAADDSVAWAAAVSTGLVLIPANWAFKVVTGCLHNGQLTIQGYGPTSQLYCDASLVTVTGGSSSLVDNVWLGNITPPWLLLRNPANFGAVVTVLTQSSTANGYQPNVNDPEYTSQAAAWNIAYGTSWSTQNIGPQLNFKGAAANITVSRIYGRFVCINIMDAVQSTVRDCDFRGGKGVFGAIFFDNCTNGVQRGSANSAINNRVYYTSFCGITMFANDDFQYLNNHCYLCGESGLQTAQTGGVTFTASVGGATGGTLTAGWPYPTGTWSFNFSSNETRTVTIANGATAVTWAGALAAGTVINAGVWGILGIPASLIDPRNYRGQMIGNRSYDNYYDGLDFSSIFPVLDATNSRHQIVGNYTWNNWGTGMNVDGLYNTVKDNHIYLCGTFGIWGTTSFSDFDGNWVEFCNTRTAAYGTGILAQGVLANNRLTNNLVIGLSTSNAYGMYAPPTAYGTNDFVNNKLIGTGLGATIFAGNTGSITGVYRGNTDATTGLISPQSFTIVITNNGGVLQHVFYGDQGSQTGGRSDKVAGATSGGFTNTPTGADAATAFAAGAKIGSATPSIFWLNTGPQSTTTSILAQSLIDNITGALQVHSVIESININGVTQFRLGLQFFSGGGLFALNTANITPGKVIYLQFSGELS